MSYAQTNPSYWQALQPDGPWEAGGPGWAAAPFVGWGHNPDRSLPPFQATDGCGCTGGGRAMGATSLPIWPAVVLFGVLGLAVWGTGAMAKALDRRTAHR